MFGNEWNCWIYQESVLGSENFLSWKRNTCSLSHQWEFVAFSLLRQCHEQLLSESTGLSPAFWNCFKIDLYLENVRENYFNSIKRDVFFTLVKFSSLSTVLNLQISKNQNFLEVCYKVIWWKKCDMHWWEDIMYCHLLWIAVYFTAKILMCLIRQQPYTYRWQDK